MSDYAMGVLFYLLGAGMLACAIGSRLRQIRRNAELRDLLRRAAEHEVAEWKAQRAATRESDAPAGETKGIPPLTPLRNISHADAWWN